MSGKDQKKGIKMDTVKTDENLNPDESVEIEIEEKNTKGKTKKTKSKEDKKIAELEARLEKLDAEKKNNEEENKQLKDKILRISAEFENYKNRREKEAIQLIEYANEGLILDILTIIDDLERSILHADDENNSHSIKDGVKLIYKNLMNLLQKKGLQPINAVGEEFDPEKHQALVQVDSDKYESGYVVDEHLKGYNLNGKVIRHSQVLVAK
ncbi:MAG: nucleotide exchange factor GrpE [Calditrichaceae bacterium]